MTWFFADIHVSPVTIPNTGHMDKNAAIKNTNFVINYTNYKCNQLCCGLFACQQLNKVQQQQKVTIKFSLMCLILKQQHALLPES